MAARNILPDTVAEKQSGIASLSLSWTLACLLPGLLVLLLYSPASAGENFLYLPNPVEKEVIPLPGEGVLVRKIIIRPGDTLSILSRRFSGKGTYFPQILLFNKIRNPDRIYAGRELLVPVSTHLPSQKMPLLPSGMPVRPNARSATHAHQQGAIPGNGGKDGVTSAERKLYAQAAALFSQRKYRQALDRFNRFLEEFPHSSLVPDASLYRADCYLHLSEI
jgi:LysM repeat protein